MPAHLRAQHRGQRRRVRDDRGGRMIGGRVGRQAPEPVVEQRVRLRVRLRRQPERHRVPVEPGHPALEPEERRAQARRDARVPAEHVGRGCGGMAAAVLPDVLGGDVALPAGDERGVDVAIRNGTKAPRKGDVLLARDIPLATIFRGVLPFLAADLLHLAMLMAFPALALALPALLGT